MNNLPNFDNSTEFHVKLQHYQAGDRIITTGETPYTGTVVEGPLKTWDASLYDRDGGARLILWDAHQNGPSFVSGWLCDYMEYWTRPESWAEFCDVQNTLEMMEAK